jgi:hypothetical protein
VPRFPPSRPRVRKIAKVWSVKAISRTGTQIHAQMAIKDANMEQRTIFFAENLISTTPFQRFPGLIIRPGRN